MKSIRRVLEARRGFSRRGFLWTGGAATAFLAPALAGFAIAQNHGGGETTDMQGHTGRGVPRAPYDKNAALIEPEVRRSANGELRTNLRVGYTYKDIGGYRLSLRSYEGTIPGPTLRVKPGDVLRMRLTNDNVMRMMEPGESYDIEIAIPKDHPRGTYWYHPHHHGSADVQMTSGMAGALIVEGDFDDVPEIAAAAERELMLNEVLFDYRGTIETYDTVWPEAVPRFLSVNGQRVPIIRMRPGEVQRWRIIHAGHENDLNVALEKHPLHAIAYDGIRRSQIDRLDNLLTVPGQRADVLVKAGAPGTYALAAVAYDQGYPSPVGPLARVIVEGEPLEMRLPTALKPGPLAAIRDAEITNKRA